MKSASSNLTSIWSQRSWAIPLAGVALAAAGNATWLYSMFRAQPSSQEREIDFQVSLK